MARDVPKMLEEDEDILNPAPYKYHASISTKAIFLLFFILGLIAYYMMIKSRHDIQNKFIIENSFTATRLESFTLPELNLIDPLNNMPQLFSHAKNRWTLINIWASWCAPCLQEMPSLELLQQKMGDKLNIIAISLDDDITLVRNFIEKNRPSFLVLLDKDKTSKKLFNVEKYPETFLISPDQKLAFQISGPRDWSAPITLEFLANNMKQLRPAN